jgi:hypothetical protein
MKITVFCNSIYYINRNFVYSNVVTILRYQFAINADTQLYRVFQKFAHFAHKPVLLDILISFKAFALKISTELP